MLGETGRVSHLIRILLGLQWRKPLLGFRAMASKLAQNIGSPTNKKLREILLTLAVSMARSSKNQFHRILMTEPCTSSTCGHLPTRFTLELQASCAVTTESMAH